MRAINLRLKAFGPFKDEINIDFDKFGNKGLYLISGATGSGKTSLFDAISFALFGSSSGGIRDEKMLRYTGATPDIKTFVELEFEYKKKIYKIKRIPRYERYKRAGEGTTDINTKHSEILLPSGELITGLKEVDEYIFELLGIDANQFSQIVMLAQGNFMALLKASSTEKMDLFRKIFLTHKYQTLESDIFNNLKIVTRNLDNLNQIYNEILTNIKFPESENTKFEELKNKDISEIIGFINNVNEYYYSEIEVNYENIKTLEIKRDKLKEKHRKIKEYIEIKKEFEDKKERFILLEKDYEEIRKRFSNLNKKEEELEKEQKRLIDIDKELEKFNKLEEILNEKEIFLNKLKLNEENISDIEKNIEKIQTDIEEIKTYIEDNKETRLEINTIENELKNLENKVTGIEKSLQILENKNIQEKKKEILVKEYNTAKEDYKISLEKYTNIKNIYFESQVGILAKQLKENEACPVCGSKDHPNIAKFHDELPDKEAVEKSEKELNIANKKLNDVKSDISKIEGTLAAIYESVEEIKENYNIENNLDDALREKLSGFNSKIYNDTRKLAKLREVIEKVEKKQIKIKELYELSEEKIATKRDYEKNNIRFKEKINILEDSEQSERNYLGDKNKEDIIKNKELVENKINNLKKYIKKTRISHEEINREYHVLKNNIETLENRMDKKYALDIGEVIAQIDSLDEKLNNLRTYLNTLNLNVATNENQLEKIKKIKSDIKYYENEYANYTDLNNVLKGQIKGSVNIRFETFVQIKYFDEILHYANKRFHNMTEGKFSLQRRKGADNLNVQTGLDFEVVDHHNKTARNINTLSGGESFQAALSLALGLSDVVQMHAGGIQLDSMFIDEGFGTLDRDTLSKVMSSLSKISKFNKLIGIISHVEVLKEQIDKQLIVEKTNKGYSEISKQIY